MRQAQHSLAVQTRGRGLHEVTTAIADWAAAQDMASGLLTVFCRHTSASLTIQENADASVQADLERFFAELVPDGAAHYRHTAEGADDMPSHIRAALTDVSLSIPLADGRLALGTWQGIYLFEHRTAPHRRHLVLHLAGA